MTVLEVKPGSGKTGATRKVLVSATAVNASDRDLWGYSAASVLFATAFGVVVDGVAAGGVIRHRNWRREEKPYLYQLMLRVPAASWFRTG